MSATDKQNEFDIQPLSAADFRAAANRSVMPLDADYDEAGADPVLDREADAIERMAARYNPNGVMGG